MAGLSPWRSSPPCCKGFLVIIVLFYLWPLGLVSQKKKKISTLILVYSTYRVISLLPNLPLQISLDSWSNLGSENFQINMVAIWGQDWYLTVELWWCIGEIEILSFLKILFWRIFYAIKFYKKFEIYGIRIFCWKCFILLMKLEFSQL